MAANNGPVCNGDSITLNANDIPGANYFWTGPNGFNAIGQQVAGLANPGTYNVEVTSSFGCTNSAATIVEVNPTPGFKKLDTVCNIDTAMLIANYIEDRVAKAKV